MSNCYSLASTLAVLPPAELRVLKHKSVTGTTVLTKRNYFTLLSHLQRLTLSCRQMFYHYNVTAFNVGINPRTVSESEGVTR